MAGGGIGGDDEFGALGARADQRAGVVAGVEVEAIIHPLLLGEFELARQARAHRHEDQAVFALLHGPRRGDAIGQAPAQDPSPVVEHRPARRARFPRTIQRVEGVARVGPAHVRGHRAFQARRIVMIGEVRQRARPLAAQGNAMVERLPGGEVGGQGDRHAVGPTPGDLGHQGFARFQRVIDAEHRAEARARRADVGSEGGDVFLQFAIGEEGSVAAEGERHGRAGDFLRFVGIAEQELACRQRAPTAIAGQGAVADHPRGLGVRRILSGEHRIADAIGEAEVLRGQGVKTPVRSRLQDRRQGLRVLTTVTAMTGKQRDAALRLGAQTLDPRRRHVKVADRLAARRVHLRVQRHQHVDLGARIVLAAPDRVPGRHAVRRRVVAEDRSTGGHAVDELVGQAAQGAYGRSQGQQAQEGEGEIEGHLGPYGHDRTGGNGLGRWPA